jgi:Bifunctional DNA primase/polymerase, N-terminal
LPTVKTPRGYHVYFRGPACYKDFGNGEYRGDSAHYCLLPPSQHPKGIIYTWLVPLPNGDLPVIDPYKAGLIPPGTQSAQKPKEVVGAESALSSVPSVAAMPSRPAMATMSQDSVAHANCPTALVSLKGLNHEDQAAIENAIATTQPESEGQRHRKVFDLCRHLKAIPSLTAVDPATLRPVVKEWHSRAVPVIGTKKFSESYADFLEGWKRVKWPAGHGPIEEAFQQAMKANRPPRAASLYPDEQKMVDLAALCRELQQRAGDADFFLDCRTAGRLLGVPHKQALKMLRVLCADRVLALRDTGSLEKHQASKYHYVAWKERPKAGTKPNNSAK